MTDVDQDVDVGSHSRHAGGAAWTLPDAPGVWPVSGHKGTCQQWRDGLVKQEVVLKVEVETGGGREKVGGR